MSLYSHNNQYPSVLPFRITLNNGKVRTDPSTFTVSEISRAGYVLAPDKPTITDSQRLGWDGSAWVVVDIPQPTPMELLKPLEPFQFWAALELSGKKADLLTFVDGLPTQAKIVAQSKLNHSKLFHPDNDLVLAAKAGMNLSDADLVTLWKVGEAIS